jgi:glutaminyl-tRNA synthetase
MTRACDDQRDAPAEVHPESIRNFCDRIGVARREKTDRFQPARILRSASTSMSRALRVMAVLDPVKLIITNYQDGQSEEILSENGPDESKGSRVVPFSKELWIEREDFMEVPEKKWFRLAPGATVRLKSAYIVTCNDFVKDANGRVSEIHCSYFPESRSGDEGSGRKVKGTIHWVSVPHAVPAEIRLYDRLFKVENPSQEEGDFKDHINPGSLEIIENAYVERSLREAKLGTNYQFIRKGYFCLDKDSSAENLVFNRTVFFKGFLAKAAKKGVGNFPMDQAQDSVCVPLLLLFKFHNVAKNKSIFHSSAC